MDKHLITNRILSLGMTRFIFFILFISVFLSCKTQAPVKQTTPSMENPSTPPLAQNGFTSNGSIYYQGLLYQNPNEMADIIEETGIGNRMAMSRVTKSKLEHDSLHYFEIGYYRSMESGENIFAFIIAWKKTEGQWLKELEVLHPKANNPMVNRFLIEMIRKDWMKYANAHQPDELVKKVYTKDAVYLQDGIMHKGTSSIVEQYQYMKNSDWQIDLTAKEVLLVDHDIVFEIGEYHNPEKGHYLLVWKKETRGPWKATLDFNTL